MQPADLDRLASQLAANRRTGHLSNLPIDLVDSQDDAEALQGAALECYDDDFCGYALVGTSEICRRSLGLRNPIFVPIPNRSCLPDDSVIRLPAGVIGAQCELALTIGGIVFDPENPEDGEIDVEILACHPTISLLGHRARPIADTELAAIADFGLHVATILGPRSDGFDARRLDRATMSARIDGKPVISSTSAAVMGHPLNAVVWLARALQPRHRQLNAGDIVTVGSFGPILQVLPGQSLTVDCDTLGKVTCRFE